MKAPILQINNVSLNLSGAENYILKDIQYKIYPEDFIILLGSNGSGKSSLLKLIDRRTVISSNKIILNGIDINNYSNKEYSQKVKTLTQNCNDSLFPGLTLFENYLMHKTKSRDSNKIERQFLQNYLESYNQKLCDKLDQVVDVLSGGEKQTFALAMTILEPPLLLLLDEHTSALDPKTAHMNMLLTQEMIQKNKITCLLTTHNLHMAEEYGNRILGLKLGEIIRCIEPEEKSQFKSSQMFEVFY